MPSITSWMRLEPRSRTADMKTSLQARVYDPLWLLARQWQMGEFQGEDNGTPVVARLRAETSRLTRYHPGPLSANAREEGQKFDGKTMPLETLVERETVRPQPGEAEKFMQAVEAGLHFLRLLEQQPLSKSYRAAYLGKYSFSALTPEQRNTLDNDSLRFIALVLPRALDGRKLYVELRAALHPTDGGNGALPAEPQIATSDVAEIKQVAETWLQWYDTLFSQPASKESSWAKERLEYAFSVAGRLEDGEKVLTAKEYFEGRLDWYAFDFKPNVSIGAIFDSAKAQMTRTTIPAPVTYRGMPALRFWEFEDAQVDFGAIETGPEDLARLLFIEFALTFGNDWFVIPVDLEVGALCRTRSLVITDTFGVRTLIKPPSTLGGRYSAWRMFQLTSEAGFGAGQPSSAEIFFLPPVVMKSLESKSIEEVLFIRDEMANLAWGIERIVESPISRPLNRYEAYLEQERRRTKEPGPAQQPSETLAYRLATEVPDYWIPLVPVSSGPNGIRLKRGRMYSAAETAPARGRLLEPLDLSLNEEEVPREGIRVTRNYQHARWVDGSTHLWVARYKGVGRGEGSSGLQYDIIE